MTLVEVMIAGAIATSVILAVSESLVTTHRSVKGIMIKSDWETLTSIIRSITTNPALCKDMVSSWGVYTQKGSSPNLGQTPDPLPLTKIATLNSTFLTSGSVTNGIYPQ